MGRMNKLLISEYPILLLATLAIILGFKEDTILKQMHYWLRNVARNQARYPVKDCQNHQDYRWWTFCWQRKQLLSSFRVIWRIIFSKKEVVFLTGDSTRLGMDWDI
jgi:hypothetical protein